MQRKIKKKKITANKNYIEFNDDVGEQYFLIRFMFFSNTRKKSSV